MENDNNSIFTDKVDEPKTDEGSNNDEVTLLRKRLADKDAFIEQLKGETKELRGELNTRLSIEQMFEKAASKRSEETPPVEKTEEHQNTKALDVDQIRNLVTEVLTTEQTKSQRSSNIATTARELKKAWGDNYVSVLTKKAEELGVGPNFLDEVAGRSPKALLKLVGVDQEASTKQGDGIVTPPVSSARIVSTQNSPTGVRDEAAWEEIKKTDRAYYFSKEGYNRRHKDAMTLGEAYFKK